MSASEALPIHLAVDIDGTLTAWSEQLLPLMALVVEHGGRVTLLTGTLNPQSDVRDRERQVAKLGARANEHYNQIRQIYAPDTDQVARAKADFCREASVTMVFEDTPKYIAAIRARSPKTACWLVGAG